jgi:hypothetical protein
MTTAAHQPTSFAIRLDPLWRAPLLIIGVTPAKAQVTIEESSLRIRYGLYEEALPLADVVSVEPIRWPWYYGVGLRLGAGALGYVGAYHGVVRVTLRSPHALAVMFRLRMQFKAVALSLRDPDGFIQALRARITEPR